MHNGKYQCRKLHIPPTNYHNNNKSIFKAQNLVPRDYSKCIHTHPPTHTHTKHSDYTKQQTPGRLGMDKDTRSRKIWQVYNFGKRNIFRLDLNESREGFCRRGRGRSFHVDGLKTEKVRNQQWRVWCEEFGG